jgi:hypothetical protein
VAKRRRILKSETSVNRLGTVKVYGKLYVNNDQTLDRVDLAVPDHEQAGFHLRHLKDLTIHEVICLQRTLADLLEQYGES